MYLAVPPLQVAECLANCTLQRGLTTGAQIGLWRDSRDRSKACRSCEQRESEFILWPAERMTDGCLYQMRERRQRGGRLRRSTKKVLMSSISGTSFKILAYT
jgi:hypothetical protein